jgi:hypothetical protein
MRKAIVPVSLALCAAILGGCAGGGLNGGSLLPSAARLHSLDSVGGGILAKRMHHDDSVGGGILAKRMHHDDSVGGGILKKH